MRKIREVLRLKAAGASERRIAAAVGVVRSTVQECCALVLQSYSYRVVRALIKAPATATSAPALDLAHDNVRGSEYFQ